MSDKLDAAIKGLKEKEETETPLRPIPLQMSTGRGVVVALPVDSTDAEIAEVAGWLLTSVTVAHRNERARRIVIPEPGLVVSK